MPVWTYRHDPMVATFESEAFSVDGQMRQRVTKVQVSHLYLPARGTPRLAGQAAPMPLSQHLSDVQVAARVTHTDRGHLVGLQFGGPEHPFNLVPMYSGFNGQSGAWGSFERTLREFLAVRGRALDMFITLTYGSSTDVPAQVPSVIAVSVSARGAALPASLQGLRILLHTPPSVETKVLDERDHELGELLETRESEMVAAGWFVEDHIASPGRNSTLSVGLRQPSRADFGVGRDMAGTLTYYATRPYAVLDYLRYRHATDYARFGFPTPTVQNVTEFSTQQLEAIRYVNVVRNGGVLRSDLAAFDPFRDLMPASTDAKAVVDHIWPKQNGGANAFSNARLISQRLNTALNDHTLLDRVAQSFLPVRV